MKRPDEKTRKKLEALVGELFEVPAGDGLVDELEAYRDNESDPDQEYDEDYDDSDVRAEVADLRRELKEYEKRAGKLRAAFAAHAAALRALIDEAEGEL